MHRGLALLGAEGLGGGALGPARFLGQLPSVGKQGAWPTK